MSPKDAFSDVVRCYIEHSGKAISPSLQVTIVEEYIISQDLSKCGRILLVQQQ